MALTRPKYSQIYDTDFKQSVKAATTETITLSGGAPATLDTISLQAGDRVLVKDQSTASQNGIYTVATLGSGSNGTWTRSLDANSSAFVTPGMTVYVEEGATNSYKTFRLGTPNPITLGSTGLTFIDTQASASVAGTNKQIQYNNSGAFAGATNFVYDNVTGNVVATATTASTSATTGALTVKGGLGVAGTIYADQIRLTNNGAGTNVAIGDDAWLGDINTADTIGVRGQQDPTKGYIVFGDANKDNYIGRSGTNPLTVTGAFSTTGVTTITSSTASTSTSTGALVVTGGVGIGGAVYAGSIQNTPIGATTRSSGAFTTLAANGATTLTAGTASTSTGSGTLVVTGGIGASGAIYAGSLFDNGTRVVSTSSSAGNLTISGTGINLASHGPGATTVGSSSAIPVVTTDVYGRITALTTASISTTLSTAGGTGTGTVALASQSLTIAGGSGISTSASSQTVTVTNTGVLSINGSTGAITNVARTTDTTYVGTTAVGLARTSANQALTGILSVAMPGSSSGTLTLQPAAAAGTTTITLPATTGTVVTTGDSGTVTSTMIANDTIVNADINSAAAIAVSKLAASTISGVTLGNNLNALTIGTGLGGTSYNGSGAVTITNTGVTSITGTANQVTASASTGGVTLSLPQSIHTGATPTFAGLTTSAAIVPNANVSINLGSTSAWFNNIYGKSSQALYADLAENYIADSDYEPGTVVVFGGTNEITITDVSHDTRVAGVISTNPAYLMNSAAAGLPVAFTGRVPCKVIGTIRKGDVLVASSIAGYACKLDKSLFEPGCVLGKALEDFNTTETATGVIEVVVGRF